MTLLTTINDVQRLCSLAVTATIVADGQEEQNILFALARTAAKSIARRHEWPQLKEEHTFTATTGATLQTNGKPSDFDRLVDDAFWNRTTNRKLAGVTTSPEWQALNGLPVNTLIDQLYMLRRNGLHIWPAPGAADSMFYEYIVNTPVQDTLSAYKTNFTADTDTFVLSEELLKLELVWRWKKTKGLDYSEDMRDAELLIEGEINATRGKRSVHIAAEPWSLDDGNILESNWPLP